VVFKCGVRDVDCHWKLFPFQSADWAYGILFAEMRSDGVRYFRSAFRKGKGVTEV
jgi:hypothetical protein